VANNNAKKEIKLIKNTVFLYIEAPSFSAILNLKYLTVYSFPVRPECCPWQCIEGFSTLKHIFFNSYYFATLRYIFEAKTLRANG
jgi:hypothetical protein